MKRFIVTLALLGFCIGSASAIGVAGADHNWTIHVGDGYYGVSGYDAKSIPGLLVPNETRLHFGKHSVSLFLPFYWVTGIAVGFLGVAMVICAIALHGKGGRDAV